MEFTDAWLGAFITDWEAEFGEHLAPDRARAEATRLLELIGILRQSLPSEQATPPIG
jgi:hypothetical protein